MNVNQIKRVLGNRFRYFKAIRKKWENGSHRIHELWLSTLFDQRGDASPFYNA